MARQPRVSARRLAHRSLSFPPGYPYARNTWLDTFHVTRLRDRGLINQIRQCVDAKGPAARTRCPDNRIYRGRRLGRACVRPFAGTEEQVIPSASSRSPARAPPRGYGMR